MTFDRVVLINLDKRKDRLGSFMAKIANIPELQKFVRFRAIHGDSVGVPGFFVSGGGAWGCRESHRSVLSDAILDGVQTLLVLEDDVCFCPNFSVKLKELMAKLPSDWDGLMLGGQNHGSPGPTGIDGLLRATNTQRTHAYAVNGLEPMRSLYRLWSRCDRHIDHWFGQWQSRQVVYQPDPFLCGQDEGSSDIFGRNLPIRFWSAPSEVSANRPINILVTSKETANRLRPLGLHWGNDRCPQSFRDKGLIEIDAAGWQPEKLSAWASMIVGEASDIGDVPCFWHDPMPNPRFIADRIGRPTRIIETTDIEDAAKKIPEIAPRLAASKIVWCWRGKGVEILEGMAYHGWHRGFWRDDISGLDQGIRRIVESNSYSSIRSLVAQLRRETETIRRGKPLIAHPDMDVDKIRDAIPNDKVVELIGSDLNGFLLQLSEESK